MTSPQTGAQNAGGVGKIAFLPAEKSPAQMPYRRKLVSIRHCGSRPRRSAGGGIRGVTNKFGGSRTLMFTVTVQLTSTKLVVWKSVYDTSVLYVCDTEQGMLAVW